MLSGKNREILLCTVHVLFGHVLLFLLIQSHTHSCEFLKIPCVHPECGVMVKKADLPEHLEKACKCRLERCGFCKLQINLNKMKVFTHQYLGTFVHL